MPAPGPGEERSSCGWSDILYLFGITSRMASLRIPDPDFQVLFKLDVVGQRDETHPQGR